MSLQHQEPGGSHRQEEPPDLAVVNIGRLVTCPEGGTETADLGVIEDAALTVTGNTLAAVGTRDAVQPADDWHPGTTVIDAGGRAVLPGFVDCHTHLCFAGNRQAEYQQRLSGVSYEDIARAGGGILSTVAQTREALSEALPDLQRQLAKHLDVMMCHGTTTAEVKSGYGLDVESELSILRLYRELERVHPMRLVATFLGAHELPAEFRQDGSHGKQRYLDLVTSEMIPEVTRQGLAEFCDVFCEQGVFDLDQARKVLEAGLDAGLGAKIHCDQFHAIGGTRLAIDLEAVSADHLHVTSDADAECLAQSRTVAVGLPGVSYFLGLEDRTPWKTLHEHGGALALATDFNPGTCNTPNLQVIGSIASSGWRVPDALILRGITIEAARALGRERQVGSVEVGKRADVVILDCAHEGDLSYRFGINHVDTVIQDGRVCVAGGRRV